MFALIAIFPLVYAILSAYPGFPLKEQNFDKRALQNESLVVFLELNLTDVQQFNFFIPNGQVWILTFPLTAFHQATAVFDFLLAFLLLWIFYYLLLPSCHSWLPFSTTHLLTRLLTFFCWFWVGKCIVTLLQICNLPVWAVNREKALN